MAFNSSLTRAILSLVIAEYMSMGRPAPGDLPGGMFQRMAEKCDGESFFLRCVPQDGPRDRGLIGEVERRKIVVSSRVHIRAIREQPFDDIHKTVAAGVM